MRKREIKVNRYILLTVVIIFATVAQGAYFTIPLIVLNCFFLVGIAFEKKDIIIDFNAILLAALFFVMVIASFFSLSTNEAVGELLKYSLFPLAYIYAAQRSDLDIGGVFYKAFAVVMFFGLAAMVGFAPIGGMVNIAGRFQSFFQYANTAALAMGIGVFYSAEYFRLAKKREQRIRYAVLGGLFLLSMVLTMSRVAFVLFAPVFLLYIFRFVALKIKLAAAGGIALLWGILAVADARIMRISLFAPTLVERYISYLDALQMLWRYPLGLGLANWQFLHLYYQSAPYQVRFIHNFYLHLALDGGFLALGVFLAVCGMVFIKAKRDCVHFYIGIFVLAGVFFEVHFSFGVIIVYFVFLLADIGKGRDVKTFARHWARYAVALPVIPLAVLLLSVHFYNQGVEFAEFGQPRLAYQSFTNARRLNPFNDSLYFARARVAPNREVAFGYLYRALDSNPYDAHALFALAEGHAFIGDTDAAYHYASRLLDIFPFSRRNQRLVRGIVGDDAVRLVRLYERIAEIDGGINPLYRHIDPMMDYIR